MDGKDSISTSVSDVFSGLEEGCRNNERECFRASRRHLHATSTQNQTKKHRISSAREKGVIMRIDSSRIRGIFQKGYKNYQNALPASLACFPFFTALKNACPCQSLPSYINSRVIRTERGCPQRSYLLFSSRAFWLPPNV